MIETKNLTKTFDNFTAVDSLDLKIETGEFFGLLGPNGAGKTTTISLLSTLLLPTKGEILIDGQKLTRNRPDLKRKISVITQEYSMRQDMNMDEIMEYQGRLYFMPRKEIKHRQVGLQRQEAVVALLAESTAKQLRDLAKAGACGHIQQIAGQSILDVDISDLVMEQFPALRGVLLTLNKVGKIERRLEVGAGQPVEQQFAAGTGVSVDALLIFMEQDNVMLFRDPDKLTQLIQHHIGIAVCIGILGDEEAEHPDEGAVQQLGRFAECFQLLQLLGKALFIVHLHLADGRTQAGNAHTCGPQLRQKNGAHFLGGVIGNALVLGAADADILHPQIRHSFELLVKVLADLIRKTGNFFVNTHKTHLIHRSLFSEHNSTVSGL